MASFSFLFAAGVFPLIYLALNFLFQKEFLVHSEGIVLISGASTGIGRHAAEKLASEGYKVYCGVRKEKDRDNIMSLKNPNLVPIMFDVTKHETNENAIHVIEEDMKKSKLPFAALVNNAGISRRMAAEFHEMDDIHKVFETNVFGMMDLTQRSLPLLRQSKGRIVMISSLNGKIGTPLSSTYVASKFAMEGYSDSLRRELINHGVSVSVVEPGYVKSSIFATNEAAVSNMIKENNLAEKVVQTYPHLYDEASNKKREESIATASEPSVTSEAILHAIRSQFPKTRYAVASGGKLSATAAVFLTWILPDRVVDSTFP